MAGEKPLPFLPLFLGALAVLVLGAFLVTLLVRDRFVAGYLGVGVILLAAAAVTYRR